MRKREREATTRQGRLRDQPRCPKEFELPIEQFEVAVQSCRTTRVEREGVRNEGEWAGRLRGASRGLRRGSKGIEGDRRPSKGIEGYRRPSKGIEGHRRVSRGREGRRGVYGNS